MFYSVFMEDRGYEPYEQKYGGLWQSLRGREQYPEERYDHIIDAVFPRPEFLMTLSHKDTRLGLLNNYFKSFNDTPTKEQSNMLRQQAQIVVQMMPDDCFENSTDHLNNVIENATRRRGFRTTIWSYEIPLFRVNEKLWKVATQYIDYHDPQNL